MSLKNFLGNLASVLGTRGHFAGTDPRSGKPFRTRSAHLLPFDRLDPEAFERLCLQLFLAKGFDHVEHTGAAGSDRGVDISIVHQGKRIFVQCKRRKYFGPKDAISAITEIQKRPSPSADEIILIVSCRVRDRTREAAREMAAPVPCSIWGETELDAQVSAFPRLVENFFGILPPWGNRPSPGGRVPSSSKGRTYPTKPERRKAITYRGQDPPSLLGEQLTNGSFIMFFLYVAGALLVVRDKHFLLGSVDIPFIGLGIGIPVGVRMFFFFAPLLTMIAHMILLFIRNAWPDSDVSPFPHLAILLLTEMFPLCLLLWIQIRFLPYHSVWLTRWHKVMVISDIATILYLGRHRPSPTHYKILRIAVVGLVAVISLAIAIIPPTRREQQVEAYKSLADLLHRNIRASGERFSRVAPADLDVSRGEPSEEEKLLARYVGLDLTSRDLRYADLTNTVLINADFRGSDLTGADLSSADLRGAKFGPLLDDRRLDDPPGPDKRDLVASSWRNPPRVTLLRQAKLQESKLRFANLIRADLTGATLIETKLQNADLGGADLRQATLQDAHLEGAELSLADLTGADLRKAYLLGTSLSEATLVGARLDGATALAAGFFGAHLQGATLDDAVLDASDFESANVIGTSFRRAYLRGVMGFEFEAVDLRGSHVDGLDRCASTEPPQLTDFRSLDFTLREEPSFSKELRQKIEESVVAGIIRNEALERIVKQETRTTCLLNDPSALKFRHSFYYNIDRVGLMADWPEPQFLALPNETWVERTFQQKLANELMDQACESRLLAEGIVYRMFALRSSPETDLLRMLEEQLAEALRGLTETDCLQRETLRDTLRRLEQGE